MSSEALPQRPAVRAAAASDLSAVRALFIEYGSALNIDLSFQNFQDELDSLPGSYAGPEGVILISELANSPVGVVALRPRSPGICEMKRLYVRDTARGLGIGALLVEEVIEHARKRGYSRMVLDTLPQMTAAIRLYESRGFKPCDPYYSNPNQALFYTLALR